MNVMNLFGFKIIIKPSFWIVFFITIALGSLEQFFIILIAVTIHELSHVAAAFFAGLKPEKIIITPIGEIAVIKGLEQIGVFKRSFVVLAGPVVNIIAAVIMSLFTGEKFINIKNVNLFIAIFNLLPVYPLDGGRFLQFLISRKIGVLSSNKFIIKISSIISIILICIGVVQFTLFPYNMSIFCIGVYLLKRNKKEYINMTFEFYKTIINYKKRYKKKMPVRLFYVDNNLNIKNILYSICWDYYSIFIVGNAGKSEISITERDIINYIQYKGLNGSIYDVKKLLNNSNID